MRNVAVDGRPPSSTGGGSSLTLVIAFRGLGGITPSKTLRVSSFGRPSSVSRRAEPCALALDLDGIRSPELGRVARGSGTGPRTCDRLVALR